MSRISIPVAQAHGLAKALATCLPDGAEVRILDADDVRFVEQLSEGFSLPEGTIEVRQGDTFCAINLNGEAVEST